MLTKIYKRFPPSVRAWIGPKVKSSKMFQLMVSQRSERSFSDVFYFYNAMIDAEAIIRRHARDNLVATTGYQTNFLGVRIHPKFFPVGISHTAGTIEHVPIPANWHADISEWAAVLRAVELSRDTFRMLELGCGWGCWMNNAGIAARNLGRKIEVIGVEADKQHIAFAKEACTLNGLAEHEVRLFHGIAAARTGTALFPRQTNGGASYGLQPVFDASSEQQQDALRSGEFDLLPMVELQNMIGSGRSIDLLHIDIQGGEADFIKSCIADLTKQVAYLVVGTHSREIEGQIFETLRSAGWILEIERPAILNLSANGPTVTVDGVQGWINTKLRPL